MAWKDRKPLYEEIEKHRNRPLIAYVTSKREGAGASMSAGALPSLIEQIDAIPAGSKELDFLIVSLGGDPMMAWRIITLIRQRVEKLSVLIPQSAYSAATLVALGANEIVIHPNGHIGPVDMQITTFAEGGRKIFSTEDISSFLDFVRDNLKITDQEHIRALFEVTCRELGTTGIGFTARSSRLAIELSERLLALHMDKDEERSKRSVIVENLSRKFQSHAYPVNRTEAIDIGLPVKRERDEKLENLMWKVWLDIENEFKENFIFDPVLEAVNSNQGTKLLSPVPQLDIPMSAVASSHYSTTIKDVQAEVTSKIDPVDVEFKSAVVESSRIGRALVRRGKILACRNPDLFIKSNMVTTFWGWE